ncbi:MAG: hypothetical protein HY253_06660 [Burkholderiales bacterium]|nr:hypothetical protein [Burkholderiales bacterium]
MEQISTEQWNDVVTELTVIREAFATLIYTLARSQTLRLDEFDAQLRLTASKLDEPDIAQALTQFGKLLAHNVEMAHLDLSLSAVRKRRDATE